MRHQPAFHTLVILALLSGCALPAATPTPGAGKNGATRQTPAFKPPVLPTGGAPLLSDKGAGLVSNNGGGLIGKVKIPTGLVSNNGGGLLSDKGAGVVIAGGGLISDKGLGYRALALEEKALIGATVTIVDPEGKAIPDAEGKPYQAVTDETGAFSFATTPRGANLVVSVALPEAIGPMLAYLPDAAPGAERALEVTGPSTLVMGYILESYVKGDLAVLQKLPAAAEAETREKAAIALGDTEIASFKPEDVVAQIEAMRKRDTGFDAQVAYVESLLVGGLKDAGEGQLATTVSLTNPTELILLPDGAFLVAERNGHRVRRIHNGRITTFAGKDGSTGLGDGGPATEAFIDRPVDVAADRAGNVYIADYGQHRVRKVDAQTGIITTVAGNGADDGPSVASGAVATATALPWPNSVMVDSEDRLVFASAKGGFRLLADGTLERLPINGNSMRLAADGTLYAYDDQSGLFSRFKPGGAVETMGLPPIFDPLAGGFAVAPDGTLYAAMNQQVLKAKGNAWEETPVAQAIGLGHAGGIMATSTHLYVLDGHLGRLWKVGLTGQAPEMLAGAPDVVEDVVAPDKLSLNRPTGLTLSPEGFLTVADGWNGRIWQRRADGQYHRLAGNGRASASTPTSEIGDGGPAKDAKFGNVGDMRYLPTGELLVADIPFPAFRMRQIAKDGTIRTLALPEGGPLAALTFAVEADGALLFSDGLLKRVVRVKDGVATEVIPPGKLELPNGICPLPDGSFYVVDSDGNAIYHAVGTTLTRIAGGNGEGFAGDGGPALAAQFNYPFAIVRDDRGDLFIADSRNDRVRRIDMATGTVETVAGLGGRAHTGSTVDDSLKEPLGLVFDRDGHLYIADSGHNQVKVVKADMLRP